MGDERTEVPGQQSIPWLLGESVRRHPSADQARLGRVIERQVLRQVGARQHPRSGAGSIKDDGSDDETVYEIKSAKKAHTLRGDYLNRLYERATKQGKEAVMIVVFTDAGIRATITLERDV